MNQLEKWFPWSMVGVGVIYLVIFMVPGDDAPNAMPYESLKSLPVYHGGRLKPLDTVARTEMLMISGSRESWTDNDYKMQPAIVWLMDTISAYPAYEETRLKGFEEKAFTITSPWLKRALGLKERPENRYSLSDMVDPRDLFAVPQFNQEMDSIASSLESKEKKDEDDEAFLAFYHTAREYQKLLTLKACLKAPSANYKVFRIDNEQVLGLLHLQVRPRLRYALTEFEGRLKEFYEEAERAQSKKRENQDLRDVKLIEVAKRLEIYVGLVSGRTPLAIPPTRGGGNWLPPARAYLAKLDDPLSQNYFALMNAYAEGNVPEVNRVLDSYRTSIERVQPDIKGVTGLETFFNHADPLFHLQHLYMLVFLFGCLSWLGWSEPFRKAGLYLAVFAVAVHTLALMARMYISGRPPVTNLYSSAIFIGWGAVLTGIVLDFIYRNGVGVAASGFIGLATLVVARFLSLSGSGDTMEALQAVLDTNFWLATHVTTVTFGYTATYLAGFIGMVYIIAALFTPAMTPERSQTVGKMIYGTVCFAMLLSFVGTVLGGIWADQSWGRFWGWDPKENGALLIVIWNALVLHARWAGMVKLRGMAMLAVAGNIVTTWSWFGTNMLGVGLHAYGFIPGTVIAILIFDAAMAIVICMGFVPQDLWRSHVKRSVASI